MLTLPAAFVVGETRRKKGSPASCVTVAYPRLFPNRSLIWSTTVFALLRLALLSPDRLPSSK